MKSLFPGHFKESESHLREVWRSCDFVFDANILLNLYRYSDSTRKEFLALLGNISDRVWLPYRAAEEYLNNRLSVIGQQERAYENTVTEIESLKSSLDNARQHPFVSEEVMSQADSVFEILCDELSKNKNVHSKRILKDDIKESISKIFEGRVGRQFSDEELESIFSEGDVRYKQKVPPGFKDAAKSSGSELFLDKCRDFGDLIVWKQVLEHSKGVKKSIVLVTDDKKEDWWEKFHGKTIGPRPELVKEFKEYTGNIFYMYQADRFLELARENLGEQVSSSIVEEIREVRRRDKLAGNKKKQEDSLNLQAARISQLMTELRHAKQQMVERESEIMALKNKQNYFSSKQDNLTSYLYESKKHAALNSDFSPNDEYKITSNYNKVMPSLAESQARYQELQDIIFQLEQELADNMRNFERQDYLDD